MTVRRGESTGVLSPLLSDSPVRASLERATAVFDVKRSRVAVEPPATVPEPSGDRVATP
jgi:hypothetical protein